MKKLSNLVIISVICCFVPLQAQNTTAKKDSTLTRELTLEKEYNPSIRDASKINTLPELKEPDAPKAKVEYARFSIPYEIKPQLNPLQAGAYFTEMAHSKKRGYLSLGIGSFNNIDGDAGYQILHSDIDQLNIFASHRSSNGSVEYLQNEEKQKMKINDNLIGLTFDHLFGNTKFFSGLFYTYSAFNYYGYTLPSISPYSTLPVLPEIDKSINQTDQIFDVNLGLTSNNEETFNYLFKVNYSHFNQKYRLSEKQTGPQENALQLNLNLSRNWDAEKILGLDAFYKGSFYTLDKGGVNDYWLNFKSYSDIGLNPYFFYDGGNWNARLGVLVDVLFNHNKDINVAPDIELNFRPTEKVQLYLLAKGGVSNNNLKNSYYENRYILPSTRVLDSYSSFDATFGVKSSIDNFWFDLFAGYKTVKDEHFDIQYFSASDVEAGEQPLIGGNFSFPVALDGSVFKIGGNLKYQFTDAFELGLKAVYYAWTLDDMMRMDFNSGEYDTFSPKAYGRPDFTADLNLGYKFSRLPLRLDLTYSLETGRDYSYLTSYLYSTVTGYRSWYSEVEGQMKNVNALHVKAQYAINDTFSAFLGLNNLLFQKYDLWYGYPAQKFNAILGVNIKF